MSASSTHTTRQAGKAVHFGAGNIGRGFVACFLHESGYEVVFADVNEATTKKLNTQKSYKVLEVGSEGTSTKLITNYRAVNSKTHESDLIRELATADLITCSVGPNILKFIAPVIAKGIYARTNDLLPVAVIACENAIGATDMLADHIRENYPYNKLADLTHRARFANSAIDRIVPAQDPDAGLDVKLEKFYEWIVEKGPFQEHGVPPIKGVQWVDNLLPYIERKLYTVNTGHATAAYHGYNRKKRTVHDALQDREILGEVTKSLDSTSDLIVNKHNIDPQEQKLYRDKIISRISNPHLEDVVERVGRAPLRKLGRKERFIGPAVELAEHGKDVSGLLNATEMAFRFQNVEGDDESFQLGDIMTEKSAPEVIKDVCGVEPKEKLYPMLLDIVERVQADSRE